MPRRTIQVDNRIILYSPDDPPSVVDRFQAELGPCTVISTGGLAQLIMPHSRTIQHFEPWLTLQGLRLVYERNS